MKVEKVEKVEKEGLKFPPRSLELTTAQKEVLHLLTDEFLTIKQIAQRRKCSIQAVYKIIAQLKERGILGIGLNRVEKVDSTFNQTDVRLHGQEFNIRLIFQEPKYQELLEKSNIMFLDGNTIRLYKNSIELYLGQSFFGKEPKDAEKNSLDYLHRFLARLEHELSVCLTKPRARNIKIVNQHYARGDSELAEKSNEEGNRMWIYAEEDGKLAFITDDSFGFREDETVHPITAKKDREAVDKQVNDWRLNNPPTNSQLAVNLNELIKISTSDMVKREEYSRDIVEHKEAIKILGKAVNKLTKVLGGVLAENRDLKLRIKSQTTLGAFS